MKKRIYVTKGKTVAIDNSWDCPFYDECRYCEATYLIEDEMRLCEVVGGKPDEIPDWCPLEDAE